MLQVDGHTDRRPISTPRFPSNWELSTARAIQWSQFLISQGIPPDRIAAAGFAEFQPLDTGGTRCLPAQPADRDQADHPLSDRDGSAQGSQGLPVPVRTAPRRYEG